MEKKFFIINFILFALLIALDISYIVEGGLLLKSLASSVFVIIGVLNLIYAILIKTKLMFPIMMSIGLIFAMLGDIILNIEFIAGAVLFGVGHIFFFIAYLFLEKFSWKDLLVSAIIFIPSMLFILLAPIFNFNSDLMVAVAVIYALIISLMTGKAISNLVKNRSLQNIIIAVGSIMFFLSDLMLLLGRFAGLPVVSIICLVFYYPAEFLLAFSILIYARGKGQINKKTE